MLIVSALVLSYFLGAIPSGYLITKKIKGFDRLDALLLGVETRTSSPVVIVRDDNFESIPGLYPCGEGAGYAGGITTAAIDGIKTAEKIVLSLG